MIPKAKIEKRLNEPPENKSINEIKLLELTKLFKSTNQFQKLGI